jgi:hypothetical protein
MILASRHAIGMPLSMSNRLKPPALPGAIYFFLRSSKQAKIKTREAIGN